MDYVEANGHLPADVETAAGPAGIGAFARGCAAALLARDAGKAPAEVTLSAGRQTPAIAETIAEKVLGQFRGWPIHDPQLDPERLLLHTRLQCWTLRPAPPGQTPG